MSHPDEPSDVDLLLAEIPGENDPVAAFDSIQEVEAYLDRMENQGHSDMIFDALGKQAFNVRLQMKEVTGA